MNNTPSPMLKIADAAEALGVSTRTIRRMVARNKLRVVRLSLRTWRFRPLDIERCKSRLAGEELE